MQNLIQVINKLQDCFSSLGTSCPVDLPQIAVVGEQSAGKSSVLENFVGKDFLPRGSGIVTRRPLILQLINTDRLPEYAEFLHLQGRKFTDFIEVRKEIENETDRVTGTNKNISPIPINLRVYSPNVLNLTLIDLPGLTKVPVGDQPADIEKQIRDMITSFISTPNCLILAVTPAIIDLANSEALKLSREVDPQGLRTIGVITKIDMMDKGTNCKSVLLNQVYPLRRGYVGIVNRSQRDIAGHKDIRAAQEAEMMFFASHPSYKNMVNKLGSKFLQETLSEQLSQHIKDNLPGLKDKLMDQLREIEKEMDCNQDLFILNDTFADKARIFMQKIQELSCEIDSILGYQHEMVNLETLSGGSLICKVLNERFISDLKKSMGTPESIKKEIKIAIQNSQGVRHALFSADPSFNAVVRKNIENTRECCLVISDLVGQNMSKIVESCCIKKFQGYPNLLNELLTYFGQVIQLAVTESKKQTAFMLDIQLNHVNTNHPDFLFAQDALSKNESNQNDTPGGANASISMEKQIFKRAKMNIVGSNKLSGNKEFFFVLKGHNLYWYKDDTENSIKNQITVTGCQIREYDSSIQSKRNCFTIYNKDGRPLGKDLKTLELNCSTSEETQSWKSAFIAAGVLPDKLEEKLSTRPAEDQIDVSLIKQVEYVYTLYKIYFKIVSKIEQDIVSKICVFCIIKKIRKIIMSDLITHFYTNTPLESLMEESPELVTKRKELMNIYNSCKSALSIVDSFIVRSNFTKSTTSSSNENNFSSRAPTKPYQTLEYPVNSANKMESNHFSNNFMAQTTAFQTPTHQFSSQRQAKTPLAERISAYKKPLPAAKKPQRPAPGSKRK